jgi:hypothetical protein
MVKVRMKTTSAGPNGTIMAGQETLVSIEEAEELVSGGYAEYVEKPKKQDESTLGNDQNEPEKEENQAEDKEKKPTKGGKKG